MYICRWRNKWWASHPADDGLCEVIGRTRAQRLIDVGEVFAVKLVEFAIIGGVVFRAVPPVPVATFGNKNFFESEFALGLAGARGTLRIELARMMEVVPGAIVFGSTDPDIEVGVDPRAGEKGCETRKILVAVKIPRRGNVRLPARRAQGHVE